MSRSYKRRKKKPNIFSIFFGLTLVGFAFLFSIYVLSEKPISEFDDQANVEGSESMSKEQFIDRISPHAKELQEAYGVLPSIIIGQAILESNWGQSTLASQYNNLFGIKAYGDQNKIKLETKEYINEVWVTIQGDFCVYETWEESMDAHTNLFVHGVSWNARLYEPVMLANDYIEAANALQAAGYATDPDYAQKVIHVVEQYELSKYDRD